MTSREAVRQRFMAEEVPSYIRLLSEHDVAIKKGDRMMDKNSVAPQSPTDSDKETKAAPTPPMTAEEYNDMLLGDYYRDLYEGCRQPWDC